MENAKKIKLYTVAIVCVMFLLTVILAIQFIKIGNLRTKEDKLHSSLTSLHETIADYTSQSTYYSDRETFLQDYAHKILDMTKSGETWYIGQ